MLACFHIQPYFRSQKRQTSLRGIFVDIYIQRHLRSSVMHVTMIYDIILNEGVNMPLVQAGTVPFEYSKVIHK